MNEKHGSLRVWHIPQIPMPAFYWPVASLVEGRLLLDAIAEYDKFQFENNVKPDYSNAGGLSVFDANDEEYSPSGSWVDWHADDGRDIDAFSLEELRKAEPEWEGKA